MTDYPQSDADKQPDRSSELRYQITSVLANSETDVISITALALDINSTITTEGWVSATTNYYPPESYDEEGNLVDGADPRTMTKDEIKAYILSLVVAADVRAPEANVVTPIDDAVTDLTDLFD